MNTAEEFEQARQKLGLTREAMAEALGISRQGLWLILTGRREPRPPMRKLLTKLLEDHARSNA